ncbi:hypothetical protein HSIEG1_1518 [Enterococcus sp. HSIEG1]|nr:hypothetical protein HSIEG1_1518 [Enterococcus sp. HSIEG1]
MAHHLKNKLIETNKKSNDSIHKKSLLFSCLIEQVGYLKAKKALE